MLMGWEGVPRLDTCNNQNKADVHPNSNTMESDSRRVDLIKQPRYDPIRRRGLNFLHSTLVQPLQVCETCFAPTSPLQKEKFINLLDISLRSSSETSTTRTSTRWFGDLRYVFSTPIPHTYPLVTQLVLQSSMVENTIELVAKAEKRRLGLIKKRAARFLLEMRASISKLVSKTVAYLLFKVFRRIMSHLLVCPAQMRRLQQAEKSGIPILYLPLHRSHVDYMLVTWTVWHWGLRLPHVASGDNLNLSGFGWLLRAVGGFFIRRRVSDSGRAGCADQLYRSVLNSYMTEILKQGMSLEFFLEGTRNRFGKALLPKNGLISNIVNAVQQGAIKDVWLVPVSITYDQAAEGIFFSELMGMRKQRESVLQVFKGVAQTLGSCRCGAVRINFSTPVLLTDYVMSLEGKVSHWRDKLGPRHEMRSNSYRELLPWSCTNDAPNTVLIKSIGYHVVYEAQKHASLSVCSVVSGLLLCKYRRGVVSLECVIDDVIWLCDVIVNLGFDIVAWDNATSSGQKLFERALSLLGESVLLENGTVSIRDSHRDLLHLAYHRNALVPVFSLISVVALAALTQRSQKCSRAILVDVCMVICDLLQYEVLLCKPCENLRRKIEVVMVQMQSMDGGLLKSDKEITPKHDTALVMIASDSAERTLLFYSNIVRPFLQSIYMVLKSLLELKVPFEGKGSDYVRSLLAQPATRPVPFVLFDDSMNADSYNNALRLFQEKGLLGPGPVVTLADRDQATAMFNSLESFLSRS